MVLLETPSRVLRRIDAAEGADMPSLPSLPGFEDSDEEESDISRNLHFNRTQSTHPHNLSTVYSEPEEPEEQAQLSLPVHSTPAALSSATTIRGQAYNQHVPSSTASAVRFASSIASRSRSESHGPALGNLSRGTSASAVKLRAGGQESFDVSVIPSLPDANMSVFSGHSEQEDELEEDEEEGRHSLRKSKDSVPDVYLPPEEDEQDFSLTEALESVSRASSPFPDDERFGSMHGSDATPKKNYDYSESLRPEALPSPFDKFRNVALRKPSAQRYARPSTRTPSLSRTTPSPSSSSSSSLSLSSPRNRSAAPLPSIHVSTGFRSPAGVPLPRSASASPNVPSVIIHRPEERDELNMSLLEEQLGPLEDEREESEGGYSFHQMSEPEQDYDFNQEQEQDISQSQEGGRSQTEDYAHPGAQRPEQGEELSSREPTFSSSEGATPSSRNNHSNLDQSTARPAFRSRSPSHSLSPAPSSPVPSFAYTPTPANPPRARPRPRFSIASLDQNFAGQDEQQAGGEEEEPLTPHTRRRSFLMDVINSSARPRMRVKFPTPHPARFGAAAVDVDADTPLEADEDEDENVGIEADTPPLGVGLKAAFAGATPRPGFRTGAGAGRRGSHPLAQTYIPSTSPSDTPKSQSRSGSISPTPAATSGLHLSSLQTPTSFSPHVPSPTRSHCDDRASFISTASSHDLTTHTYARANASFDPIMGLGERGGTGVGRFNAGKLNAYLHGLNRRLAEENEGLVGRLRRMEEERGDDGGRRLSGAGRKGRVSGGSSALGDVEENVGAEGWMEEKKELEGMVDMLTEEINRCNEARAEVDRALEDSKEERSRDKERWKERMGEVERGVEGIVKELEQKVEELESKAKEAELDKGSMERALESVEEERDGALERAEKAEKVLGDGRELGAELKEANDRVAQVTGDLRNANHQIKELEDEVMRSDGRVDELEKGMEAEKALVNAVEAELEQVNEQLATLQEEMKADKEYIAQLEADAGAAVDRIESLEAQVADADERLMNLDAQEERVDQLESEATAKADFARQMEEALESAERKMLEDEEKVAQLVGRVASLEREKEREREKSLLEPSRNRFEPDVDIEALESELDDANKEIARLSTLLAQSPARKAIEKAKDTKIDMLEKEKEDLLERVKNLRNTMNDMGTPNRLVNGSGISPIHRQVLSMSMRAPRTPGAPLRDISWLNNTAADATVAPLVAEIERLQQELDLANESIDDKLDKLEDAGLGVVGLTKKLEDARSRIVALEDEIARLSRREDRRTRRLERTRCQKCHVKVDVSHVIASAGADESSFEIATGHLPSEPPTPPTKTSEALRANLKSVNSQLDTMKKQWEDEKKQLLGENAVLQDATKRLNVQIRNAHEEVKTERVGSQGELDRAKRMIAELETELQNERSRLRTLTTEQSRVQRQKDDILMQLQRTELDMNDVKKQVQRFKQENQELETELRANTNAEQRARLLEDRVAENAGTMEQLRQERALLVADHKELQHRFSQISERANKLRTEHAASQTSHDQRRHQLDLYLVEIDDLRKALSDQADELQRAEEEKKRLASQKSDVARTVALLESDLKRVRRDAEAFGRDLKHLRAEKERWDAKQVEEAAKAERARKQSQTQIRLLNEQLDGHREKANRAKEELRNHVCSSVDESHLSALKVQHKKECKGLIVQIRYLKAKFTRESSLRCDLTYQKQYLLVLLTKFEKSEQRVLTSIARIGYPGSPSKATRKVRSLKSTVLSVMFLLRVKRASDQWKEHSASKEAVAAALQDVRRRRAVAAA